MKILMTGGGSGGHITPLLAVAEELKNINPTTIIYYVGQKGDKLAKEISTNTCFKKTYLIKAGKFRRYNGESLISHLLDIKTNLKNTRDIFYVLIGIFQSIKILINLKPNVIFVKGGYVGVPVGLTAALLKIPYITHDSDAVPGLANRIISRWASVHSVALPKEIYNYPPEKTITVGVPINSRFSKVDERKKTNFKKDIGINQDSQVLFVTGGGRGALRLNKAVAKIMSDLLKSHEKLVVFHSTGQQHEQDINDLYDRLLAKTERNKVVAKGYMTELYKYSGVADVVIARAGATNLAEFAAQAKTCIIVPNPVLTGGHQLKNADYLKRQKAIEVVDDDVLASNPTKLKEVVDDLLNDFNKSKKLAENLHTFAHPASAAELAEVILSNAVKN